MPITTTDAVKAALRIDGTHLDAQIALLIPQAQSIIEHHCGLTAGAMDTNPDPGAVLAAIGIVGVFLDKPTAGSEDWHPVLRSGLLDRARSWL